MAKLSKISIENSYMPRNTESSHRRIEDGAARHDILRRATDAGRKNEPSTVDTHLDETQRELIDESQGFVAAATRRAGAEITERCNKIRVMSPAPLDTALEESNIRREVVLTKDRYSDDLDLAHQDRQRALRDLRSFEEENRRPPQSAVYKDDALMFFSVLLALILGEGVFNAFLFQELQERGLVGGLVLALAVGLANVLMGLGTGFLGWRLMTHVRLIRRLLGILITLIFMAGALALHLALGDLREAITHDARAQIDFLVILKPARWFAYTSIPPFVLFAVGVATFLIAALKGRGGTWGIVAPYWGHETLDRRFRAADQALQDAKENLKDALQNAFDGERAKLRQRHTEERVRTDEIRRLAAEAHGIERTLSDSIDAEIGRLHIWLRMYRDRNRSVRTTPAPEYFETYPAFDQWRATRLDLSELATLVTSAERALAENAEKLAALEEKTLREQVALIEALLDAITGSERRSADRIAKDDAVRRPQAA
jgi:hypothetical protein